MGNVAGSSGYSTHRALGVREKKKERDIKHFNTQNLNGNV